VGRVADTRMHGLRAALLLCLMLTGPAAADGAGLAWTRDVTSAGLQSAGAPVAVAFGPARHPIVPAGAVITGVYASRHYDGAAVVATDLCWGAPDGPCVPVGGASLNTHAFDGRLAAGPMWLVHRVLNWGPNHAPLFVRGTVTVWFTYPAHR
jgi:flagellar protein FlhE